MKRMLLMFLLVLTSLAMIGCDWFSDDENGDGNGNGNGIVNPELATMLATASSAQSYTLTMAIEEFDGIETFNMTMLLKGTADAFHVEMNEDGFEVEMYIVMHESLWYMCIYYEEDWLCWESEGDEENEIISFVDEMKLGQWNSQWFAKEGNVYTLKPEHFNDALNLVEEDPETEIEHLIITLTATTMKIEIKFINADTPGYYEEVEVLFSHLNNTSITLPDLPLDEE